MASKVNFAGLYPNTHVQGFETVMANLNAEIIKIKGASIQGLIKAAAEIRRDTEKTPYITPLDKGNLRSSWFTTTALGKGKEDQWSKGFRNNTSEPARKKKVSGRAKDFAASRALAISECTAKAKAAMSMGSAILIMGYSANYAVYVHENMTAKFHRKPEGSSGAKWFQKAVYRNRSKVLQILKENIQL